MREVTPKMKSAKEELIRLNALSKKPIAKLSMMALTSAKIAEYRDEMRILTIMNPHSYHREHLLYSRIGLGVFLR